MLDLIVEHCQFLLNNFPEAQSSKSYLDSRLTQDSQNNWGFGYFPNLQNISALTDLIEEDQLIKEGLLNSWTIEDSLMPRKIVKDFFEDHPLILPQRDTYGKVVALIGRTLLDEKSQKEKKVIKYKNTSFKKGHYLFGLYENKKAILDKGYVYLVEGQLDVIKSSQIGLHNIVGLGSSSLTFYQLSVISRYTDNIFLLLDNDEAGQQGREQIIKKYGKLANICNFYLPEIYKDIDEYITCENIKIIRIWY